MFHKIGDRRVHSVSFGIGDKTIVGVAGSFANWEIWIPTFEYLSQAHRVVSFDHDGVGQTKVPVDEISPDRHLETFFSVLDAQQIDRCTVVGDSNNATLAIRAALAEPDRFDGLIVVNGHAWGFDYPGTERFVAGLQSDFAKTVDFFVRMVFPEPDTDHLKAWLTDIIHRTGPDAAAAITKMYFGMDLRSQLGNLDLPCRVIHGALDNIGTDVMGATHELVERLGADLVLIDDAGHLPLFTRPEVVARAIAEFVGAT